MNTFNGAVFKRGADIYVYLGRSLWLVNGRILHLIATTILMRERKTVRGTQQL